MKYVAFLDILGFRKTLEKMNQDQAEQFISSFSATAYYIWKNNPNIVDALNGYIVSDSFIIYTNNTEMQSLQKMISIVRDICRSEFIENNILIRAAIAKGSFDKLKAHELSALSKGLIVGQAYIDAYLLEEAVKIAGIVLSDDVYLDYNNLYNDISEILSFKKSVDKNYNVLRYLDIDYLLSDNNIIKFTGLAQQSKWLPHYYNTIYLAIRNENKNNKVDKLFSIMLDIIFDSRPSENWYKIDDFIENAFSSDVDVHFRKSFLRFIRNRIL